MSIVQNGGLLQILSSQRLRSFLWRLAQHGWSQLECAGVCRGSWWRAWVPRTGAVSLAPRLWAAQSQRGTLILYCLSVKESREADSMSPDTLILNGAASEQRRAGLPRIKAVKGSGSWKALTAGSFQDPQRPPGWPAESPHGGSVRPGA